MPETVLFSTETTRTREEIAGYLRSVADRLDDGAPVTLTAGSETVTLEPPERLTFEVKAERETGDGQPELSVEFELEWDEGGSDAASGDDLRIE